MVDYSNLTKFDFTLEEKVTITEAFYPKFNILKFLSETGGAVGLWLGLGMVQIVKYGLTGAQIMKALE